MQPRNGRWQPIVVVGQSVSTDWARRPTFFLPASTPKFGNKQVATPLLFFVTNWCLEPGQEISKVTPSLLCLYLCRPHTSCMCARFNCVANCAAFLAPPFLRTTGSAWVQHELSARRRLALERVPVQPGTTEC